MPFNSESAKAAGSRSKRLPSVDSILKNSIDKKKLMDAIDMLSPSEYVNYVVHYQSLNRE